MKSATQQKQSARKFVEYWIFQRGSEKGEDQQFWNSLLGEVLGLEDVKSHVQYQVPVPMKGTTKFLDAWIPETRVLIEHKSRGVNLDAPQAGHNGLTPYEQAVEYDNARAFDEKARWIVTCNFDEFRIYDRSKPLAPPLTLKLANLPKEAYRLNFLVNPNEKAVDRELEISVQAGRIVGELYDAFLKQYGNSDAKTLAALNRLCVRLVFCLYAEDAEIFPKDCFRRLVESSDARRLRSDIQRLFVTLDTPLEKRDAYLESEFQVFPYTNGGLFRDAAETDIPPLTEEIRKLLIGATQFDWREITPTIFGALFESTLNPVTRRAGGMVYTSVENIHKVIDPLFLDDLTRRVAEVLNVANVKMLPNPNTNTQLETGNTGTGNTSTLETLKTNGVNKKQRTALLALQDEIAALIFLDPASGSGNFLTETFICLRRLENKIIAALQQGQGEFDLGTTVKVSISQFHGIEINDFAVSVAKTALWIAEAQMLKETAEILHREPDYLPLKDYDGIIEGNALRMDWGNLLNVANVKMLPITNTNSQLETGNCGTGNTTTLATFSYIMGNPPFVGYSNQSAEQKADMLSIFVDEKGKPYKTAGKLDYVCAWYRKAVDCILGTTKNTKCAFVSTNSICQGESVAAMWKPLFEMGLEFDFAHRTFRWDNEAQAKAHVHCVIIGFSVRDQKLTQGPQSVEKESPRTPRLRVRKIFDGDKVIEAEHINGYLMDGPDVWVESRTKPICNVPVMTTGNRPADGGHLIIEREDYERFQKCEPEALAYIKKFIGSAEFINNKPRYCLWLKNVSPAVLRKMPLVMQRVEACKADRLAAPDPGRRKLANTPTLFRETNNPSSAVVVPSVSSERREYVPMGLIDAETIASNLVFLIPSATLYHFGVLTSSVHMAWMRVVAGRLKSDYRYSANIVYNNFPWPKVGEFSRVEGESVENVLDRINKIDKIGDDENPDNPVNPVKKTLHISTQLKNISAPSASPREIITQTAQAILDARSLYPDSSLADLYDPLTMPIELRKAHAANDRAVLAAYGLAPDTPEPEIVAHLFKLYAEQSGQEE